MTAETVTETKPELADGPPADARVRHYVERLTPNGTVPPRFSNVALCGERVTELLLTHNGEVCQGCIDESRRRPVER